MRLRFMLCDETGTFLEFSVLHVEGLCSGTMGTSGRGQSAHSFFVKAPAGRPSHTLGPVCLTTALSGNLPEDELNGTGAPIWDGPSQRLASLRTVTRTALQVLLWGCLSVPGVCAGVEMKGISDACFSCACAPPPHPPPGIPFFMLLHLH